MNISPQQNQNQNEFPEEKPPPKYEGKGKGKGKRSYEPHFPAKGTFKKERCPKIVEPVYAISWLGCFFGTFLPFCKRLIFT